MNRSTYLTIFLATCGVASFTVEARVGQQERRLPPKKTFEEIDIDIKDSSDGEDIDIVVKGNGPKGNEKIDVDIDLEEELEEGGTEKDGDEVDDNEPRCPDLDFIPIDKVAFNDYSVTFKMNYPTCAEGVSSEKIGVSAIHYTIANIHDNESKSPHLCPKNEFVTCVEASADPEVNYMTAACTALGGNAAHVHFYVATEKDMGEDVNAGPDECNLPKNRKICPYEITLVCDDSGSES